MELTKDFDELGLRNLGEDQAPAERLANPKALYDLHVRLREDERVNAANRAQFQAHLDGEPPYSQDELEASNQPDTTNLNFQGAQNRLERAKAPYYRLWTSGEVLLSVPTLYGQEDERDEWEAGMAEEITETIRGTDSFEYESDQLIHKHVWEGLGIGYWDDALDWRIKAGGLDQFFFPRLVDATESKQEVVTIEESYSITELYAKIKDLDPEDTNGWDVSAVKEAIKKATNADPAYQDWSRLMQEVKNNDLFIGNKLPKIRAIRGLVKEFSGKVSIYITTEDDPTNSKFIYKRRDAFNSMTEAMVFFPYSTGTNTKLHGIRGLGYKVFPFEEQRNRSISRLIDKGVMASSLMLQPADETDMNSVGLTYFGDLAVIPPGISVPNVPMPDLQRTVMPAIEMMDRLVNDRTSGYSPENVFDGDQRKTKGEVYAHLEQASELSDAALDFFNKPADRLFRQVIRRMTRRNYLPIDPGGQEIADLKLRLTRRGIPLEAFYKIDWKRVRVVRVIGAGSAAAKTIGLERMNELFSRMDDVAQATFNRDKAIDAVGVTAANRYFPKDGIFRTTIDTQLAVLQNHHLLQGMEVPVLPSDKHLAHAREHIKPLMEMFEAAQGGQVSLAEAATSHLALYTHTVEHVESISGDVAVMEEVKQYREMLQHVGEVIHNGVREAERAQEKAAEEQAAAQAQAPEGGMMPPEGQSPVPQGPSPESIAKLEEARAKIRIMEENAAAARRIRDKDAEQNQALKDAQTAADIQRKNFLARAQASMRNAPNTPQ